LNFKNHFEKRQRVTQLDYTETHARTH